MSSTTAILISVILLGAAIIVAQFVPHYQIAESGGGIYRLNTATGGIEQCLTRRYAVSCGPPPAQETQ